MISGPVPDTRADSASLSRTDEYHHPQEKESLFEEALMSLNLEEALGKLDDILDWPTRFGPKILRRLTLTAVAWKAPRKCSAPPIARLGRPQ
jgi:hypothetical protein